MGGVCSMHRGKLQYDRKARELKRLLDRPRHRRWANTDWIHELFKTPSRLYKAFRVLREIIFETPCLYCEYKGL
jgi:hypothetical protein